MKKHTRWITITVVLAMACSGDDVGTVVGPSASDEAVRAADCGASCTTNSQCDPREGCGATGTLACKASACGEAGTCIDFSSIACADDYDPVCGCDGVTYSNPCRLFGAPMAYAGECTSPVGCGDACTTGSECDPREGCMINPMRCIATSCELACISNSCDEMGTCMEIGNIGCGDQIYDPVCGCDGGTYGNPCRLHGAPLDYAGECTGSGGAGGIGATGGSGGAGAETDCGVEPGCGAEGGPCCEPTTCDIQNYCQGSLQCCNGSTGKVCGMVCIGSAAGIECGNDGLMCDMATEVCVASEGGGPISSSWTVRCAEDPCFPQNLDCSCAKNLCTGTTYCSSAVNRTVACTSTAICAAPDTLIATPEGDKRIADLKVGDVVYSVDSERIVEVAIRVVSRTPVTHHQVQRVVLSTGAVLEISAMHPTADGRTFAELSADTMLDGIQILSVETIPYEHLFTYDILPDSDTGTYFAGGVLIGSTLGVER